MTSGLLAEWSQWMRGVGLSPRTVKDRVQLVKRFEAAVHAESLTADWRPISAFLETDRFAAGTRQTYYAHLSTWFHWLVLMDHRLDDPTAKLRAPKAPRRRPRPVSLDQLDTLLQTRMHHKTRAMVLLKAYEGLRVSEVARVRGSDLRGGDLRVVGKGGVVSFLPVHELVAEIATTMPTTGYWFPSPTRLGQPVKGNSVSNTVGKLMRRAGVPGTPHALRHFFGTQSLRASKGDLVTTQQLLRHANIATTVLYTEVDDTNRRATVDALPVPAHFDRKKLLHVKRQIAA